MSEASAWILSHGTAFFLGGVVVFLALVFWSFSFEKLDPYEFEESNEG